MPSTKDIARKLFGIEHQRFGEKLGILDEESEPLGYDLLRSALGAIDRLSQSKDSFSRRLCTQMVAVAWEHAPAEYSESLRQFFIVALSRIGIAPSTIMVDREKEESGQYGAFDSYFAELETTARQLKCEMEVCGKTFLLTEFQRDTILTIRQNRLIGISAPTSSGKSFALYLTIVEQIAESGGSVLVIVPTLSLVSQVSQDLSRMAAMLDVERADVRTAYDSAACDGAVFVLTQERAMAAMEEEDAGIIEIDYLVVDEIQNLERVGQDDEQRSKVLLDVLKDIKDRGGARVVLSGPRLSNIDNLGFEIFGEVAAAIDSTVSPVVNFTYSVSKRRGEFWLKQYVDTLETPIARRIDDSSKIAGIGKSLYNEAFLNYLESVVGKLGSESRNLIFSPTGPQARKTAMALAERREAIGTDSLEVVALANYLAETVHPEYSLARGIEYGVAYHSGKVPSHARVAIEAAFRMGLIKDLVCTTTLMQGVNLPATTVVVRNPRLFVRKTGGNASELSAYEFANLRGRAGRLLKDFIGRTVVLDESSFEDEAQEDLFGESYKELVPGYKDAFLQHQEQVLNDIRSFDASPEGSQKFLVTYIRQTLLRMGSDGEHRLREVGIALSDDDIGRARESLQSLKEPTAVYTRHRFWDPLDIENLFAEAERRRTPAIPKSVWDEDLADILRELVLLHRDIVPYYVERYLGGANDRYVLAVCISAEKWSREFRLRRILDERDFQGDVEDQVEKQIDLLTRPVVYGLTSLLKPYADRFSPDSGVLSAIEMGAYKTTSRELMHLGLSRDTAIRVGERIFSELDNVSFDQASIRKLLRDYKATFDLWTRREVEAILGE